MKQKSKNRFFAALLAAAMMFQMLPMMAFAAEGTTSKVTLESNGVKYASLEDAVRNAKNTDTIQLGKGNYTLYGTEVTAGKDLTFVGLGPDKTAWNIGAKVLDSGECDTTYQNDFSLKGSNKVTFKNMTLRSGTANYLGFRHSNDTVVENCALYGRTTYWGYNSAKFIDSTFYAPNGDYAIWTYYCKEMTFESCTFNTSGKAVNVYSDFEADQRDYTINFNNCTVNSTYLNKQALNINDSNKGTHKNTININNSTVTAKRDSITCSQVFGFGEESWKNAGNTDVYLNGELVWKDGKMQTHAYTDGEKDKAYNITYDSGNPNGWVEVKDGNNEIHFERTVTKTCKYCGREFSNVPEKGYQLSYELNGGTDVAGVYDSKIYPEGEKATVAAAPTKEGCKFAGWKDGNTTYEAGTTMRVTKNTTLTASWEADEDSTPAGGGSGDGGAVVAGVLVGGAAVIGGYEIATHAILNRVLPDGALIPSNRAELALLLWEHADKPEPQTPFTFSDIDADNTDLQKAAQWCVENGYLHVKENDDRFFPRIWVPKAKVIQAWDKAFGLQAKLEK